MTLRQTDVFTETLGGSTNSSWPSCPNSDDVAIVTVGAGFIGSHLVNRLVKAGQMVRVIEHPDAVVGHLPSDVEVIFADIRDRDQMMQAMKGGRWVFQMKTLC